jgi:Carbohydrate-selective porin, OprB family/S-layer homology domain
MSKLFWRALKSVPAVAVTSLLAANAAFAQTAPTAEGNNSVDNSLEQINRYQDSSGQPMSQVTNVNQLRDVSPADWAYEALRSLVDRYGCIAGFPNQTYRGSQALTRYEFAAGLNSCLNQIERLIASSEAVVREDIDTINRLTQEFEAELATIGGRIDSLEGRTAFLEDHQFSTTTKLKGEAIFAVADTFGDAEGTEDDDPTQTTFSDRVRLNFDSSFYGEDRLRIRLQAGNVPNFSDSTGFDSTRLAFDNNNGNSVEIDDLYYTFPLFDGKFKGYVGANGLNIDDIFYTANPILESSGTGALSRFGRYNPLVIRGVEGAGLGASANLGEKLSVTGLYLTDNGADPSDGEGVANGSFSTGAQVKFSPNENLDVALSYVYGYQQEDSVNLTGSTASDLAQSPFGDIATRAHNVGLGANFQLGEKIVLAGWGGGTFASDVNGDNDAVLYTANLNVSLLDLGKEGAVLSLGGGVPPSLVKNEGGEEDEDTTFLIEASYKYPINDNILITPGAYYVISPDGNSDNENQIVGVLRTTFQF